MPKKKSPVGWIVAIAAVIFIGVLAYSTMQQTQQKYEVCMSFKDANHCATAAGATYDLAVRSAQEIDCELLSNGRNENMACLANQPTSIRKEGR